MIVCWKSAEHSYTRKFILSLDGTATLVFGAYSMPVEYSWGHPWRGVEGAMVPRGEVVLRLCSKTSEIGRRVAMNFSFQATPCNNRSCSQITKKCSKQNMTTYHHSNPCFAILLRNEAHQARTLAFYSTAYVAKFDKSTQCCEWTLCHPP